MPAIDYTLPLDQLPDPLPIEPLSKPFDVTITPPGSKSITCRAYVLAALAQGESKLIRPLRADDTDRLLEALCTFGAQARWEGEDVYIKGVGGRFPRGGNLYMGDGGTPTRFMIACACLAAEPVTIDASPRMRERPIAEGVEMLRQLGARIEYVEAEGRLPVRVTPNMQFIGGAVEVGRMTLSQFLSAIMLVGPLLERGIELRFVSTATSAAYLDLTWTILSEWDLLTDGDIDNALWDAKGRFRHIQGEQRMHISPSQVRGMQFRVEPDASSAFYWLAAGAIVKHARLVIPNLDFTSGQPDCWLYTLMSDAGPEMVSREADDERSLDVIGTGAFAAQKLDCANAPDGAVLLAGIAPVCEGTTHLCGLRTLRVKETDRIAALGNELRKIGCIVETGEDWIEITPPSGTPALRAGHIGTCMTPGSESRATPTTIIETYNDHRMAMAFAVLGLVAPNGQRLAIRNPRCVAKSYPTFWKDFAKLYQ